MHIKPIALQQNQHITMLIPINVTHTPILNSNCVSTTLFMKNKFTEQFFTAPY